MCLPLLSQVHGRLLCGTCWGESYAFCQILQLFQQLLHFQEGCEAGCPASAASSESSALLNQKEQRAKLAQQSSRGLSCDSHVSRGVHVVPCPSWCRRSTTSTRRSERKWAEGALNMYCIPARLAGICQRSEKGLARTLIAMCWCLSAFSCRQCFPLLQLLHCCNCFPVANASLVATASLG